MGSSGRCAPAHLGATCRKSLGRGRRVMTASCAGGGMAPGIDSWPTFKPSRVRSRRARRSQPRQHGDPRAPARGPGTPSTEPGRWRKGAPHPADEGLGRSRGGLTSKLHLACDQQGRPLSVVITPGQRHESTQIAAVLDVVGYRNRVGPGGPASARHTSSQARATAIRPADSYYAAEEFGTRFPSDVISSSAGQHARADHPLSMPQHTADAT